ncbi:MULTISPECIES: MBL fold metallo-hydrolase [Rhizobium]|uniref:MBL fold metallo-hydrolase n=1 Tax=Rhizobium TaxID=379 RepID=UPI001EF04B65|nr:MULTISPECIES: hypothetical protein [Rhizobium]
MALLGIGAYAPRWFMKPVHIDPAEAVVAHKDLGAKLSIGMHFGTFQLAAEPFEQPRMSLREALEKEGVDKDSFVTLQEGETRVYDMERSEEATLKSGAGPALVNTP